MIASKGMGLWNMHVAIICTMGIVVVDIEFRGLISYLFGLNCR